MPIGRENPKSPRVSVVMATYNYGQYIAQAIQSVIDQTYTDWELKIVDDGSTDSTPQVVQPFLDDPRVQLYRQQNLGQPKAKNEGLRLCTGELVAFLDADDAWLSTKLEKQVTLFDIDPDLGVAYTGCRLMSSDGSLLHQVDQDMLRGDVLRIAIKQTIPPFSSSMVRRDVFSDVGLFDESIPLAIDYELWMRVALKYTFDFVDEPLLLYRTGHANLSRRSAERRRLVLEKILPEFLARPGVRERVGRLAIAEAYADTYLNQAIEKRTQGLAAAIPDHLRAIGTAPWMWSPWRGLIRACLPNTLVQMAKSPINLLATKEQ